MSTRARLVWAALIGLYLLFVGLTAWSTPFIANVGTFMQPNGGTSLTPIPTFYILTESGLKVTTEAGVKLRTEIP